MARLQHKQKSFTRSKTLWLVLLFSVLPELVAILQETLAAELLPDHYRQYIYLAGLILAGLMRLGQKVQVGLEDIYEVVPTEEPAEPEA